VCLSDEILLQKAGDLLIYDRILALLVQICKGPLVSNNQDLGKMIPMGLFDLTLTLHTYIGKTASLAR
jgi:hypothetical protein